LESEPIVTSTRVGLAQQDNETGFETVFLREFKSEDVPNHTKILTCFNHSAIVVDVLSNIVSNSSEAFDLHIIDDSSEDGTLPLVVEFGEKIYSSFLRRLTISRANGSKFETQCDDFGIRSSRTKYVILIQSDVLITQSGYDKVLLAPLQLWGDLIAISGRGTEPIAPIQEAYRQSCGSVVGMGFLGTAALRLSGCRLMIKRVPMSRVVVSLLVSIEKVVSDKFRRRCVKRQPSSQRLSTGDVFPTDHLFSVTSKAGYLDASFSNIDDAEESRGRVWIGDTVMRGPLAIDKQKYFQVGGFDTSRYFLGFDDHDLFVRSFIQYRFRVGFTPVNLRSDLAWGSTRKKRSRRQTSLLLEKSVEALEAMPSSAMFQPKELELGDREIRELDRFTI